jgi:Flp pilus assembly protein TadD
MEPQNPVFYRQLGEAYRKTGKKNLADQCFNKADSLSGQDQP